MMQFFNLIVLLIGITGMVWSLIFAKLSSDRDLFLLMSGSLILVATAFLLLLNKNKIIDLLDYYKKNNRYLRKIKNELSWVLLLGLLVCLNIVLFVSFDKFKSSQDFFKKLELDFNQTSLTLSNQVHQVNEVSQESDNLVNLVRGLFAKSKSPVYIELNSPNLASSKVKIMIDKLVRKIHHPHLVYENKSTHSTGNFEPYLKISYQDKEIRLSYSLLFRTTESSVNKSFKIPPQMIVFDNIYQMFYQGLEVLINQDQYFKKKVIYFVDDKASPDEDFSYLKNTLMLAGVELEIANLNSFPLAFQNPEFLSQFSLWILDARAKMPPLVERFVLKGVQIDMINVIYLVDPVLEKGPIGSHAVYFLDQWGFLLDFENLVVQPSYFLQSGQRAVSHPFVPEIFFTDYNQYEVSLMVSEEKQLAYEKLLGELADFNLSSHPPMMKGVLSLQVKTNKLNKNGKPKLTVANENIAILNTSPDSWQEMNLKKEIDEDNLELNQGDVRGPHQVGWLRLGSKNKSKVMVLGDSDFIKNNLFLSGFNQWFSLNLIKWFITPGDLGNNMDKVNVEYNYFFIDASSEIYSSYNIFIAILFIVWLLYWGRKNLKV